MFRRNRVSQAAALVVGGLAVVATMGAVAQTAQRVEVTGSAIKRTDVEGPAPVEIITRKEIERTGATSINELVRSIPSIDIFDQGELASNSPAGSGTGNLKMRGLSESNLLVLLNGRRLPVNAIYDSSGAGAAVDINTIPLSAVERVEILKDGGSAIYGADAVAGVINIITKTDYQGIEARAGYGQSSRSDGKEKTAGIVAGFGDLSKDRYNILVGVDVFKRDPILRKDRDLSSSVDFRRFGGPDRRSGFAPTGNVVDPATGGFVGVPYRPCPADSLSSGVCRYDFNQSLLTAYNGADRMSGILLGSYQVTPSIRAFAEVVYSKSKDHFDAHPVPDYFVVPTIDPSQVPYEFAPGQIYIAGRFMQGGPRMTDRDSSLLSTVVGAEGTSFNLDWKANLGRGVSKVTNNDSNYFDRNLWTTATSNGSLDPTVSTNPQALVDSLKVTPKREGRSTIEYVNGQVGGDAVMLPAGPLRYAVGFSAWRETLKDTPDALSQAGQVVGSIQQAAVDTSRSAKAVFGELSIPVLKSLEAQAAVRYDKYPNASKTSPKIAFKYSPLEQVALRASYTESFRAPALKQLNGAQEQGAITITDPAQCALLGVPPVGTPPACLVNAFQVNGSNPNLKPEKGKTYNFGVVVEPVRDLSAAVDLWRIRKSDDITSPTLSSAIEQGLFTRVGPQFFVFTNLQNIADRLTQGVDVDLRARFPGTAVGTLNFRNLTTYYSKDRTKDAAGDEWAEFSGTYALPRWRNTFTASTEFGPWTIQGSWRTVAGFWDQDTPHPIAPTTLRVGGHEELDLQVQYSGFKSLKLTAGVKNALDRMPPFSLTNASDNQYTQMGFAELYTNRGRFFYFNVNYEFR